MGKSGIKLVYLFNTVYLLIAAVVITVFEVYMHQTVYSSTVKVGIWMIVVCAENAIFK